MIEDSLPDDPVQCLDCQGTKLYNNIACETCHGKGSLSMQEWMKVFLPNGNFPGAIAQTRDKKSNERSN